jgi:hypothetical protein
VFDAAARFKAHCLLNQQSLFIASQTLRTPEHFDVLTQRYVRQPDAGGGSFYVKLAGQLAQCTQLDVELMAELFWLVQSPPISMAAPSGGSPEQGHGSALAKGRTSIAWTLRDEILDFHPEIHLPVVNDERLEPGVTAVSVLCVVHAAHNRMRFSPAVFVRLLTTSLN